MKVADADSKLVVEVQHHALMKVKDQLLQVINLRNVRGVSQFLGLGEEKPFNVPGREALAPRARKNVMFFSTNYAISAALVGVVTILLNPMFLFVLICLAGFWLYASSVAANETAENPMLVFGKPISPEQRKLGLTGISLGVIVIFGGSILFTICTASSALAISHAILRDCPTVREEDELGFLSSDDADKIADTPTVHVTEEQQALSQEARGQRSALKCEQRGGIFHSESAMQSRLATEKERKGDAGPSSAGTSSNTTVSGSGGTRAARQVRSSGEGRETTRGGSGGSASDATHAGGNSSSTAATGSGSKNAKASSNSSSSSVTKFKTNFRNTIYDTLLRRGWKETSDNDWDFYWADREYIYELLDTVHLENGQKVNHFRNGRELCRKDLLIKNLKRAKRTMEKKAKSEEGASSENDVLGSYDFFPVTSILPGEYAIFVEEFKRNQGVWIMKPIGKAQGKGIFLFTKLSQISDWRTGYRWRPENQQVETYVVQKYISNPYLVGGKKFDLRLYTLVPSFAPLEIYLFRGGFARFTNSRYSNNPSDIANSFIHLTNVAIQKTSEHYNKKHGGKWDLRNLKLYMMMSKHSPERINKLFFEIQMVIIKSLLSIEKIMINDKHCFELYGYDIMIDENLKPWLLEVNASPSLSANTASDYQLKCGMLNDMLDIIDVENNKTGGEDRVGGFDLVYRDGFLKKSENYMYTSFLGSDIKRTTKRPAA